MPRRPETITVEQLRLQARAKRQASPGPPRFAPLPPGALVMGLDVSSTAAGWAFVRNNRDCSLVAFGVARPKRSLLGPARIDEICRLVTAVVISDDSTNVAVMEWSSGHQRRGQARMNGLAILGQAQGAVRERLRRLVDVETIDEKTWTRSVPKPKRAETVRAIYPDYAAWAAAGNDPGLDAADAIGLCLWRLTQAQGVES